MHTRRSVVASLGAALLPWQARAASYPERAVRIVCAFPAGGATDVAARAAAAQLTRQLGGNFVVENQGGAGGTIGAANVAKASPDGYTLLLTSASHPPAAAYYPSLSYDPVKSFVGVANVALQPGLIAVNAASPYRTLDELIKAMKALPGKLNYAAGAGGAVMSALIAHALLESVGATAVEIPYRGSAPAIQALVAGDLDFTVDLLGGMTGLIAANKLRPLAFTTKQRNPLMPEVPTVAEVAVPGFHGTSWAGLLAPAGTPPAIVERLNAAINASLRSPEVQNQFAQLGMVPAGGSVKEFNAMLVEDAAKWSAVIRKRGLSARNEERPSR